MGSIYDIGLGGVDYVMNVAKLVLVAKESQKSGRPTTLAHIWLTTFKMRFTQSEIQAV